MHGIRHKRALSGCIFVCEDENPNIALRKVKKYLMDEMKVSDDYIKNEDFELYRIIKIESD